MSIERVDKDCVPNFFRTGSGNRYSELIKVEELSHEYEKYRRMMDGDFMEYFVAVYRVQNKFLENEYEMKLSQKERDFDGLVDERELLHCTSNINVRSIIECNLNPRSAKRKKFGRGVSFSPKADYANLQSSGGDGIRAMFVCKVMIGQIELGSYNAKPSPPCDTMQDYRGNVFVKNNGFEYYPTYVMFYKSYPVISKGGRRSIVRTSPNIVCTSTCRADKPSAYAQTASVMKPTVTSSQAQNVQHVPERATTYHQYEQMTLRADKPSAYAQTESVTKPPVTSSQAQKVQHVPSERATTYHQYERNYISTYERAYSPCVRNSSNYNYDYYTQKPPYSEEKKSNFSPIIKILLGSVAVLYLFKKFKS